MSVTLRLGLEKIVLVIFLLTSPGGIVLPFFVVIVGDFLSLVIRKVCGGTSVLLAIKLMSPKKASISMSAHLGKEYGDKEDVHGDDVGPCCGRLSSNTDRA